MIQDELNKLGERYASAWSSQDPSRLSSFYAVDGSLSVNDGAPSIGRAAIEATASSFMTAFPDMVVKMTRMERKNDQSIFHWLWTGTNTGSGGTGRFVSMVGYEEWTIDQDGLIRTSEGHYDEEEYQRQLHTGVAQESS